MIVTRKRSASPERVSAPSLAQMVAVVLGAALLLASAGDARAHRTEVPHQLVLTQVAVESDSLRVSVWVERPTPVVVTEFRAAFTPDPQRAREQDAQFRRAKWREIADAMHLAVNGRTVDLDLRPLPLPNNGRGTEQKFVYALAAALPLADLGDADRLVVELDNQVLLGAPHVFLSAYAEAERPWSLVENSNSALLARGERAATDFAPAETVWTHDDGVRRWRLVFVVGR